MKWLQKEAGNLYRIKFVRFYHVAIVNMSVNVYPALRETRPQTGKRKRIKHMTHLGKEFGKNSCKLQRRV